MVEYVDYFLNKCPSENEQQGLSVKLPYMASFVPVLDICSVPNDPEMLIVRVGSASGEVLPPIPNMKDGFVQNFLVPKSQAIFRTISRWPD